MIAAIVGAMAVGTAQNELFLLYVAIFGASLYALVLAYGSIDLGELGNRLESDLPRRSLAALMFAAGTVTAVVWVGPLIAAMVQGRPPELLGHATTSVTEALDLAIIVPATFIAGVMTLRGRLGLGVAVALPLLVLLVVLLPVISAQTVSQLAAGITYTVPEIVGPIGGFFVLGLAAAAVTVRILRSVSR